jgi:hypothetical protein
MTDENTAEKLLETRPKGDMVAVLRPVWWTELAVGKNGSVVQLFHPDHGWLVFLFPPECASRLGMGLMKQSALCEYFAGTLATSTVTVN